MIKEVKKQYGILILIILATIGFVMGAASFLTTNANNLKTNQNYTGTINVSLNLNGIINNTDGVSVNVSIFYNASGGPVGTTALDVILNGSTENQTVYENASVLTSGLTDAGTYNISLYADDGATQSWLGTSGVRIDNTAPNVSSFVTANYQNFSTNESLIVNVSVDDAGMGTEVVYFNITNSSGQQNYTFTLASGSGRWYNATINLSQFSEGKYNITVWANDTQLNNLNNSEEIQFTIDKTAPTVTVTRSAYTKDSLTLAIAIADTTTMSGRACTADRTGATFTGSGNSQTLTESSLSCATSYTYVVTCLDSVGNSGSSTVSFSTYTCSGSSSSGGSSSTSMWTNSYTITNEQFAQGYTKQLRANERFKVKVGTVDHSVGVKSLSGSNAVILVESTPQEATLSVGETKKFDVNDDQIYDLSVTLNSIVSSKADVTVLSINEKMPAQKETVPSSTTSGEEATGTPITGKAIGGEGGSLTWLWILIIVVVIGVIVWIVMNNKKKK